MTDDEVLKIIQQLNDSLEKDWNSALNFWSFTGHLIKWPSDSKDIYEPGPMQELAYPILPIGLN